MPRPDIASRTAVNTLVPQEGLGRRFTEAVATAGLASGPGDEAVVTADEIAQLSPVVSRYLHFIGVVGRPRVWSFRARFGGRFWLRRGLGWMPADAWQYNSALEISRVFVMRIRFAGVVPMFGRDTYLDSHGRMIGKLFDRFIVVDGQGEEFDIGELTTYLNDAIMLAPSMLLRPNTTWTDVDAHSFDVTLADGGRTVTGRVFVDGAGAPFDFSTTDRFAALPSGPVRAEWRTPVRSWQSFDGRVVPGPFRAVWHLPDGELPYIKGAFVPDSVAFNISPRS
jgi:hypothetical protein